MKKLLLFITCCTLSFFNLIADELDPEEEATIPKSVIVNLYDNAVGVSYSTISGFGLNVSRRFAEHYAVTFVGMLHYNELQEWSNMSKDSLTKDEQDILYDFGIEFQRDVFTTRTTRLYGLIGAYYSVAKNNQQTSEFLFAETNTDETKFAVGAGFGFQFFLSKNFAGNLHLGYKFEQIDAVKPVSDQFGNRIDKPSLQISTEVGFGLGVSVFF